MYTWAWAPLVAGCAVLAFIAPATFDGETRVLDVALLATVAGGVLQLVPLPRNVLAIAVPGNVAAHEALTLGPVPPFMTLSLDPQQTADALAILAAMVALYWSARRTFQIGGIRQVCRAIGWLGLLLGCAAIVQLAASRTRIYGFWTPEERGAFPFGPFVNRNHAATWLVMAIPLSFGYLVARLRSARAALQGRTLALRQTLDGRTVWLIASLTAMLLALAMSLSRSGIVALVVAALAATAWFRSRLDRVRTAWALIALLLGAIAILLFADVVAVAGRFGETAEGPAGRLHIWRDTLTMCRALWATGSGLGAFQTAMVLFQTGDRTYYFNHAHNQYLQAAAEGGLLVLIPAAVALIAFVAAVRSRLAADQTGLFWIRAGAATGLFGAGVQSLWDTGLQTPANTALAAVLAALATHRSRTAAPSDPAGSGWH